MARPDGSRRNSRCSTGPRGQSAPGRPVPLPVPGAEASVLISATHPSEPLEQPQLEGLREQLVPGVDANLEGVLTAVVRSGAQLIHARPLRVGLAGGTHRYTPDLIGPIAGTVGSEQRGLLACARQQPLRDELDAHILA